MEAALRGANDRLAGLKATGFAGLKLFMARSKTNFGLVIPRDETGFNDGLALVPLRYFLLLS